MWGMRNRRVAIVIAALAVVIGLGVHSLGVRAAAQEDDSPVCSLRFVVVRDYNSKPVKNASVVMHPVSKGKQSRGGLELKTDTDGRASFDGVPYGPLRIQVLATGFQTYGQDYAVDKPDMEIVVRLKRPQGQYSIYEQHPEEKKDQQAPDQKSSDQKAPDQKPPDQKPPDQKAPDKKPQ